MTTKDYCFVTAFFDIGRSGWAHFRRTTENYLSYFSLLCEMEIPLIIFIDDRHLDKVEIICKDKRPKDLFTLIIPINEEFLSKHIHAWKEVEVERQIMNSSKYKSLISHRSACPETRYPEYNCINFAKIDFVVYCIKEKLCNDTINFYGWVDFGYMQQNNIPMDRKFNSNYFSKQNAIIQFAATFPQEKEKDPIYVMQSGESPIIGPFFFGATDKLLEFQKRIHLSIDELHEKGVADDDQTVYIYNYLYRNNDGLVKLEMIPPGSNWFIAFLL